MRPFIAKLAAAFVLLGAPKVALAQCCGMTGNSYTSPPFSVAPPSMPFGVPPSLMAPSPYYQPPAVAVSPQGVPMGVEVQSGNMGVVVSPYGQVIGIVPGQ